MENKLEQLLNSLIEKGWKPRGKENAKIFYVKEDLRDLVSKESGLWQFVCENGMVHHEIYEELHSWTFTTADHSDFWYTSGDNYEFYVIESSLKDESELEDFLFQNIKIDG